MKYSNLEVYAQLRVNEVIDHLPGSLHVFHRHGIDACCGGSLPLGAVADRHGIELEQLLDELHAAANGSGELDPNLQRSTVEGE